jgi:hypothetical protein
VAKTRGSITAKYLKKALDRTNGGSTAPVKKSKSKKA